MNVWDVSSPVASGPSLGAAWRRATQSTWLTAPHRRTYAKDMRYLRRSRLGGALLGALWCAALVARPTLLACPMGMAHATAAAASLARPATSFAAGQVAADLPLAGAESHQHQAHPADGSPHEQSPEHQHPCDCLGHCCAATVAMPRPLAGTIHVSVTIVERRSIPLQPQIAAAWVDHLIPFATAPPSNVIG